MQVSISKAHKMTGVARSTIYKDIDDGKLSCTTSARGKKTIMVSELQRVYGEIKLDEQSKPEAKDKVSPNVANDKKRMKTTNTTDTNQVAVLQERIESLTLRMQSKEDFIDDLKEERRKNRTMFEEQIESLNEALTKAQDGYNQATKLLEHNSSGSNTSTEWQKAIAKLEDRIANQEKAAKEKAEKEAEEKNEFQKKLEEQEKLLKEKEEALELEKHKSFIHRMLGK